MTLDKNLYNILIVEDNPGDYFLVEDYLGEYFMNGQLHHLQKFKEVLPLIESKTDKFDILLLDLSLPDISKEKLIEVAKDLSQDIPVIILTGYSDIDFAIKSLSLGVSDYLLKDTINPLVLYKSIIYAMERHRFMQSLRKSEKRYMDIFHMSPAPMWVYDLQTLGFLDVNQAAIIHYGYSKNEFLSMTLRDIRSEEDFPALDEAILLKRTSKDSYFETNIRHQKKNGDYIFVEIRSNSINFSGKEAKIVQATDITEKLDFLEAIQEQNKKLKEIAWTQSHVVRAPLVRLMGIIEIFKTEEISTVERNEMLSYLVSSAEELDDIIRDIVEKSNSLINTQNKT